MTPIEYDIPHKFKLRDYQLPAWRALLEGRKRLVLCWHRGAGKDLFALNWLIWRAIQEPALYLHCFPKYGQGKKAIWDSVHKTHDGDSMSYLDHFPEHMVKSKNASEMKIELHNGSVYRIIGLDGNNSQNLRGINPTHVIMSEYAYMDPSGWDILAPRVQQNNGTAIFLSTPNGQNHFYALYNYAHNLSNLGKPNSSADVVISDSNNGMFNISNGGLDFRYYFSSLITNSDTHLVSEKELEDMREQGKSEDFIQQEYFCSFTRGAEGAYYGKLIQKAKDDERIGNIGIRPDIPCCTAWDIGMGDATAIWIFQQLPSGNINFVGYYENQGEMIDHYFRHLDKWKAENKILWSRHYAPHDMANREMTGTRLEVARNMGYEMIVLPREGFDDGIQTARALLSTSSFDSKRCKRGIECLEFYKKKFNENLKVYSDEPLHNEHSHAADAFRYAAMGLKKYTTAGKLDKNFAKDMYNKYGRQ